MAQRLQPWPYGRQLGFPTAGAFTPDGRYVHHASMSTVAELIGGSEPEAHGGLLLVPKVAPTPPGFPRRVGVARKRPLG